MEIVDHRESDCRDIDVNMESRSGKGKGRFPVSAGGVSRDSKKGLTLWICVLMASWISGHSQALHLGDCSRAHGMYSKSIPDSAITASSYNHEIDASPASARIRLEIAGGAWCPAGEITEGSREYLQIDLGQLKVITVVETQGRFGRGQGQEFTDQYYMEYQREEGGRWFHFHNRRKQDIFTGNTNTYIAEFQSVEPPMIARKVRFYPYSNRPKSVCMRVEVYGCDWTDGLVSYDMRQGEHRGNEIDLLDATYDGDLTENYLSGGLGQLTDGMEGQSNFRLDPVGVGIRGYNWIGWRNDSFSPNDPLEIIFRFDAVRNFSLVKIHTNNMFTKEVEVFKSAKVYFSRDGQKYDPNPVVLEYLPDRVIMYDRPVVIRLEHNVGRYVKVELSFNNKWIMISEVSFESEVIEDTQLIVTPLVSTTESAQYASVSEAPKSTSTSLRTTPHTGPIPGGPDVGNSDNEGGGEDDDDKEKDDKEKDDDDSDTGGVVIIPRPDADGPWDVHEGEVTTASPDSEYPKERKSLDDEYIGIIIGALAALILILFAIILYIILRHRRRKYNNNHQTMKSIEPRHVTLNLNDLRNNTLNGKLSNGNMYNCVATSDDGSDREDTNASRDYAIPGDIPKSSLIVNLPPPGAAATPLATICHAPINPAYQGSLYRPGHGLSAGTLTTASSPALPPTSPSPYAMTEVKVAHQNIQGASGNNVYAVPGGNVDLLWTDEFSLMELPRENLKFVEKLGEGQFGEAHLCEAVRLGDMLGGDFLINRAGSSMMVAVKMLRRNASPAVRSDFDKEVKLMARLKDPNIVRALGVITRDEPLSVVVEHVKFGDLNQFLHQHVLEGSGTMIRKKHSKALSNGCLVYMASQVASGMKYLENLNVVHRDLAARNCLVGYNYTIKISDFGMSRSLYSNDYYRIEGKAVLPIRWMPWESIVLGKFSTKSDVWSFGVTLWEILTFARLQPYDTMSDVQVIDNCGHFYNADGLEVTLPQPTGAPREIYDLMQECWNRDEAQRPAFREIHMFLQRKNMGYNPNDIIPNGGRVNIPLV